MTSTIIDEAERYLKLLQSGEVAVSQQGAYSTINVAVGTVEKGKERIGHFDEQYGAWLLRMRTYYESMRDFKSEWTQLDKEKAARQFVEAYRWGETFRLLEVGEVKRLKAEAERLTNSLKKCEGIVTEKDVELGTQGNYVKTLENLLTKHGISFGGERSVVSSDD